MVKRRGFTLIELLVVIAIIGILSAIVLASLNSARNKASDAKVQSQLANARAAAEVYYVSNQNSYAGLCAAATTDSSGIGNLLAAASYPDGNAPSCNSASTTYRISHPYISEPASGWCVDSTGVSKEVEDISTATGVSCPI